MKLIKQQSKKEKRERKTEEYGKIKRKKMLSQSMEKKKGRKK